MRDWIGELDDFAVRYGKGILPGPGRVSHDEAVDHARAEYETYLKKIADEPTQVELDYLDSIKETSRKIERDHRSGREEST